MSNHNQSQPPIIQCPNCKTEHQWDSKNPSRPFCSPSCKNQDFVAWANEEHVLAGNSLYDGVLSADLEEL